MLTCQMKDMILGKLPCSSIVEDWHGVIVVRVDALEDFFELVPSLPAYEFDEGVLVLGRGSLAVVHRHFGRFR